MATSNGKYQEWKVVARSLATVLEEELKAASNSVNVEENLTAKGKELRKLLFEDTNEVAASSKEYSETSNVSDRPADNDFLSRDALAASLAKRLRHIYRNDIKPGDSFRTKSGSQSSKNKRKDNSTRSFFMQVDGAWGSGKSTILKFLKNHLNRELNQEEQSTEPNLESKKWIVVEFNAWQNQRLFPPWWFLMKSFHMEAKRQLIRDHKRGKSWILELKEWSWRFNTGNNYLPAALITLLLFGYSIYYG